ncbi:hypothetical protein Kpol_1062p25 [Vanderwaltozyma polyspora DSM 70294]|uniref:chitinase n=1 Tax=Vanderwaltozyma polyspora (strain ATCC 22028 / DSM 70294 / BCRC 21397 / CBS 2163 / NBRC 10782 / NRRL Y-8283 / UCD 57-17) TaxID=436907 RepID=A7TK82_VANPO|nr:uncharacterized protein Kpol_1062p25 [Vanderwaltozyma polyspora DSM 70294]EDO17317.1 hypothetical protein Kpol_1062p25 [Vanderwaltozyma polyspora DSM 70294]
MIRVNQKWWVALALLFVIISIMVESFLYQKFLKHGSKEESIEDSINESQIVYGKSFPNNPDSGYDVGVYYSNWSPYTPRLHLPHDMDFSRLTHVYYAFFVVDSKTGALTTSDNWSDFEMDCYKPLAMKLKKLQLDHFFNPKFKNGLPMGCIGELFYLRHSQLFDSNNSRKFKLIMSVGGWSNREAFPRMIRDSKKLDAFVNSCIENMFNYGFDGIELDWEFPKDDKLEPKMYLELVKKLKWKQNELEQKIFNNSGNGNHSKRPKFHLSIAAPAFKEKLDILLMREMDHYVDVWNMMTYDYHGEWSEKTGYHSNLYSPQETRNEDDDDDDRDEDNEDDDDDEDDESNLNGDYAINYVIKKYHINPKKINLGMAAYGRGFTKVNASSQDTRFINKPYRGVGGASEGEPGMWLYNQLPIKNSLEEFDPDYVSAFCYDKKSKTFVGYDNRDSMKVKAQYVKEHNLKGGFWWESCGDDHKNPEKSLLNAFTDEIGSVTEKNETMFTNIEVLKYYLKTKGDTGFLSTFIMKLLYRDEIY